MRRRLDRDPAPHRRRGRRSRGSRFAIWWATRSTGVRAAITSFDRGPGTSSWSPMARRTIGDTGTSSAGARSSGGGGSCAGVTRV